MARNDRRLGAASGQSLPDSEDAPGLQSAGAGIWAVQSAGDRMSLLAECQDDNNVAMTGVTVQRCKIKVITRRVPSRRLIAVHPRLPGGRENTVLSQVIVPWSNGNRFSSTPSGSRSHLPRTRLTAGFTCGVP
jgi:hypothetical protein